MLQLCAKIVASVQTGWQDDTRCMYMYFLYTKEDIIFIIFLRLWDDYGVIYEVIARKFRALQKPFWDLKISII